MSIDPLPIELPEIFTTVPTQFMPKRKKPGPPPGFRKGMKKPHKHKSVVIEAERTGVSIGQFFRLPEPEIRARYSSQLSINEGLFELARMRKFSEIASDALNRRTVPKESNCMICHKALPVEFKKAMMPVIRDPETGQDTTYALCSLACVREYTKMKMGMAAIPDRGMVDGQEKS